MRKVLLVSLFVLLASWVTAQPILDQSAVGSVGSTYYLGIQDTFAPGWSIGSAGANQTWDFDTLQVNGLDTVWFISPSSSQYGSNFPNSNLAIRQASLGDAVAFLELSASALDLLGVAGDILNTGSPVVVHQNPPARIAQFPFTYLNSYNSTTVIDTTVDASSFGIPFVDSARYKNIQDRDFLADGYGTLHLPAASFANALRVKDINTQTDSIWIHTPFGWTLYQDSVYTDSTFTWWNSDKGYYLAQAQYIGGSLSDIRYEDPVIVGLPRPVTPAFAVYPNPTADRLFIATDGKVYDLRITDLQGRVISERKLIGMEPSVSVSEMPRGYYLYSIVDQRGVVRQSGKLMLGN